MSEELHEVGKAGLGTQPLRCEDSSACKEGPLNNKVLKFMLELGLCSPSWTSLSTESLSFPVEHLATWMLKTAAITPAHVSPDSCKVQTACLRNHHSLSWLVCLHYTSII